ncbi:hypothetical protein LJC54_03090 [Parabacteroides sp. OttesenSCG-928-J18]|nr:hypothetical protein [Parabacteroides sp. OttesenSCG-928-J18]
MKTIEINEVYTLFEEIKKLIKKGNDNTSTVVQPEIEFPDFSCINDLTDKLEKTIEEVHQPIRTEHHYVISFSSYKTVAFIVLGVLLVVSLFVAVHQYRELASYKDNDLKYRFIKLRGDTTAEELLQLEDVFDSNPDGVKSIRKQVKEYEKALAEEAKRLERARLKEKEAERLQQEAEALKQKQ